MYDIFTDFTSGGLNLKPDNNSPDIDLSGLISFADNSQKRQTSKINEMEENFKSYNTSFDDLLGIEIHNGEQLKKLEDLKTSVGLANNSFDISFEDLNNTAKILQLQSKVKRIVGSGDMKRIIQDQKLAKDFLNKTFEIEGENQILAIMARDEYLKQYGSKEKNDYQGFRLNINDYIPIDIDSEIAKVAKDIEREYTLEKDPSSPTGDGYIFINKVSNVTESGKNVFERKLNMLRQNKVFDNNFKSFIAINSPELDYNDQAVQDSFISKMTDDFLASKIESVDIKKVEQPKVTNSATKTATAERLTEKERLGRDLRNLMESNPDYKDFDFTPLELNARAINGFRVTKENLKPNGDLEIHWTSQKNETSGVLLFPKGKGKAISTDDVKKANIVSKYGVQPGQSVVTDDGKYISVGAQSGKAIVIENPVKLTELGLKGNIDPDSYLDKNFGNKAKKFHQDLGIDFYTIKEAGIDTMENGHKNKSHYNGKTYDLSLDTGYFPADIFNLMLTASKNGLKAVYEPDTEEEYQELVALLKNKGYNGFVKNILHPSETGSTGDHFSIYEAGEQFIPEREPQGIPQDTTNTILFLDKTK